MSYYTMLGSTNIERLLYKVQPCQFPGIVADISLESLSSPSADDNLRYISRSDTLLATHKEISENSLSDINQNVENDQFINDLSISYCNGVKEPNANQGYCLSTCNKVNTSLNRSEMAADVSMKISDTGLWHKNVSTKLPTKDIYDCDKKKISSLFYSQLNMVHEGNIDKIEPIMSDSSDISSSITSTDSESARNIFNENKTDINEDKDFNHERKNSSDLTSIDATEACVSDKYNTPSIVPPVDSDSGDQNLYPIVNIRTLGDGTDGSYEINIQNLYPTSLSACYIKPQQQNKKQVKLVKQQSCNECSTFNNQDKLTECYNRKHAGDFDEGFCQKGISYLEGDNQHKTRNESCHLITSAEQTLPYNNVIKDDRMQAVNTRGNLKDNKYSANTNQELCPSDPISCRQVDNYVNCMTEEGRENCKEITYDNNYVTTASSKEYNNLLFRSYSDEGHQPKSFEESHRSYSSVSDIYDLQRKRKRKPRKLPEIPKNKLEKRKDLHINLSLLSSNRALSPSPVIGNSLQTSTLSLADELRLAVCGSDEENIEMPSKHSILQTPLSYQKENSNQDPPEKRDNNCEDQCNKMAASMINSVVSLHELGSPEDIEPPSFRDSGFFGDFDVYSEELIKQQFEIQKQQQLLLRQLYKNRNRNSYASAADCDSGYTTQDPECGQSRPSSAGPVLCRRCGNSATSLDDICPTGNAGGVDNRVVSLTTSQSSSQTDYYIDDIPKTSSNNVSGNLKAKELKLELKNINYVDSVKDVSIEKQKVSHENTSENNSEEYFSDKQIQKGDNSGPHSTAASDTETDLEITHRCCHKFVPRHPEDELFIEIGDPIYVEREDDDLWCEGVNLRTKKRGIFPSVCATDLNFLVGEGDGSCKPVRFSVRLLGSIQVKYSKGTQVLTQAINKVAMSRRMTLTSNPPSISVLEINNYGIRLSDKKSKCATPSTKMPRSLSQILGQKGVAQLSKDTEVHKQQQEFNHFYSLKNVTFCGSHPTNKKYFAFITKHPLEMKFACHVLLSEEPTSSISEAIGASFKQYYQQYLAATHPTEDIYLEN